MPNQTPTGPVAPVAPASRASERVARALSRTLRPIADRTPVQGRPLRATRRFFDLAGGRPPRGTRASRSLVGRVPTLRLDPPAVDEQSGILIYLHGGGYVFGSSRSHRGLAGRLATSAGTPVLLPDYRLAPENPFPAALEDAVAVYSAVLDWGIAADRIVVAGDSAGGHLAVCLLAELARTGRPQPAAAVLFSPVIDINCEAMLSNDARSRDPFLSPQYAARCMEVFTAGSVSPDPRLDVIGADKSEWPPVLLQVGGTEALCGDAERMAASFADRGRCSLEVWPGQVHVFQGMAGVVPEARAAVQRAGEFIRTHLNAASRPGRGG